MRHRVPMIAVALVLLLCTPVAFSQAPTAQPGPEVKKMSDMIGTWSTTYEMRAIPGVSPAAKATSTRTCVWTAGGFGVSCEETLHMGAMGTITSDALIAYDAAAKNYIHSEVSNDGEAFVSRGTVNGDTWVFDNDSMMQGKPTHGRFTAKYTSKDTCEMKYEAGPDANSMQLILDGKETRVKSTAPAALKPATK